jgi:hypothetical protein
VFDVADVEAESSLRFGVSVVESETFTLSGCGAGLAFMVECRWGVPALAGVSLPEFVALMKGGRSAGGVGRGLLFAKFRNERPSREPEEFREDVRVAI